MPEVEVKVSQEFAESLLRVKPGHVEKVGRNGEKPGEFVIVHREDWEKLVSMDVVKELPNAPA